MIVRNFLEAAYTMSPCHKGVGEIKDVRLFRHDDFQTKLKFINYAELPPHTSIGYHKHGQNEEVYVILEGCGKMTVNDETREVKAGDVVVNKPGWSHGLVNDTDDVLKAFIFEVDL